LRAAGVPANDISRINLKDKSAVARAIQKARMSRNHHGATQAQPSSGGAAASSEKMAARDVTPNQDAARNLPGEPDASSKTPK